MQIKYGTRTPVLQAKGKVDETRQLGVRSQMASRKRVEKRDWSEEEKIG